MDNLLKDHSRPASWQAFSGECYDQIPRIKKAITFRKW
jgi:hypothetical protein